MQEVTKVCSRCGSSDYNKFGNCRVCAREASRRYAERNPEKVKARRAAYHHATKDAMREIVKEKRAAYNAKNRETVLAKNREYQRANREKLRMGLRLRNGKYRAVQAGVEARRIKASVVLRLFDAQGGKCACCGKPLNQFHLDHVIPIAAGGAHAESNLQLLLPTCNLRKGNKVTQQGGSV